MRKVLVLIGSLMIGGALLACGVPQEEYNAVTNNYNTIYQAYQEQYNRALALQEENTTLDHEIQGQSEHIVRLNQDRENLNQSVATLKQEREEIKVDLRERDTIIENLKEDNASLSTELRGARRDNLNMSEQIDALNDALNDWVGRYSVWKLSTAILGS